MQDIDLTRYSTLIDTNQTWFNISAYMACANTASSSDQSTVEIRFANERKFDGNYPTYGNHPFLLVCIVLFFISYEIWKIMAIILE